MPKYKIEIAYDGTNYHGWQVQPKAVSVAKILQDTFKFVFKKNIKLVGASRTDAGVHAEYQVATFDIDHNISPENILSAWNNALPSDILIKNINIIKNDFHPRFDVMQKTYCYYISPKRPLPKTSRYTYFFKKNFDLDKLKNSLNIFIGTHDFRSFCTGYEKENTVRTIDLIEASFDKKVELYKIIFQGKSFLRYMIRRIVGASLDIASSEKKEIKDLILALNEKNPKQKFTTAPAHGLVLNDIKYK